MLLMIKKVSRKIIPKKQTYDKLVISERETNIQNKSAKQKPQKKTHIMNV